MVIEALPLIVMFLALARTVPITGWYGVPGNIVTSVVAVGTPPHQLPALFQSVFTIPIQVLPADTFTVEMVDVCGVPQRPVITTSYEPASVSATGLMMSVSLF